jgi:hypothetical protein
MNDSYEKIRFINNQNELDDSICELIENKGDYCRIKKPNGQIIRIFKDRIRPVEEEKEKNVSNWNDIKEKGEIWVKSNRFNETTVCETVAIIDPKADHYKSINTYNGKAQKVMIYSMKNYKTLVKRMARKGYEKKRDAN